MFFSRTGRQSARLLLLLIFILSLYSCNDSSSKSGDPGKDNSAPGVPTGIGATALSPYSVKVDWQPSSGGIDASEYKILRNGDQIATVNAATWTDTSATPLTRFCYRVTAVSASGKESGQSEEACVNTPQAENPDNRDVMPPSVPGSLGVVPVSFSAMKLSWDVSTDDKGVVAYKIYRNGSTVASSDSTSWSDTDLNPSTDYCYTVSAIDSSGNESAKSDSFCSKTPDNPPVVPPVDNVPPLKIVSLNVVQTTSSDIIISWFPGGLASDVKEYRIYRNGQQIGTTSGGTWTDPNLQSSANYCYTVSAVDLAGNESIKSDQICQTTKQDTEPPPVPAQIKSSSKTMNSITIEWSGTPKKAAKFIYKSGFKIYRDGVFVSFVTGNIYTDTGLKPGTRYCYTISAVDAEGNESGKSEFLCMETEADSSAPDKPSGLTATALAGNIIRLSWNASSDNSGSLKYMVYRAGAKIAEVNEISYSDILLTGSTKYCYTVSAVDMAGNESEKSSGACATTAVVYVPPPPPPVPIDQIAPSVPSNVSAFVESSTSIKLTWSDSTDNVGVTGYRIYRSGSLIATVNGTVFIEGGLTLGSTYCYKVSAIDAAGNESVKYAEICANTDLSPPSVPSNVSATAASSTSILIVWNASTDNAGVSGYKIYRDDLHKDTVTDLSFTDTGLTASTKYCYKISAIDASGNESVKSAEAYAETASGVTGRLNDTGITDSQVGSPGQDADFGRDKTNNLISDGHAGFNFTKIGSAGAVLPVVANQWSAVKDNVTGLMWEVKTDDGGLHDKEKSYEWYEPDNSNNGGDPGSSYPDSTSNYVQAVNAENFCGYNDWRMPTVNELMSITALDRSNPTPAIDSMFFPNALPAEYWSASPCNWYSNDAWFVSFYRGENQTFQKSWPFYVRLVRGGQ